MHFSVCRKSSFRNRSVKGFGLVVSEALWKGCPSSPVARVAFHSSLTRGRADSWWMMSRAALNVHCGSGILARRACLVSICPGHEQETPPKVWRLDAPEGGWRVRPVPNRFPTLAPDGVPRRAVSPRGSSRCRVSAGTRSSSNRRTMPRSPQPSFGDVTDCMLDELTPSMRSVLAGLADVLDDPDYNAMLQSAPIGDERHEYFVWHLRILPRIAIPAGFELGSGLAVNASLPDETAGALRSAVQRASAPEAVSDIARRRTHCAYRQWRACARARDCFRRKRTHCLRRSGGRRPGPRDARSGHGSTQLAEPIQVRVHRHTDGLALTARSRVARRGRRPH